MNRAQRFTRLLSILSEVVRHPGQHPSQRPAACAVPRLLSIPAEVGRHPGQHPSELASACGVSERTLRRDLHELRKLGFELGYLAGYQLQGRLNLDGAFTPRPHA